MYPNTPKKIKAVQWFLVGMMLIFSIGLIFLKPPYAHASIFPSDVVTYTYTNNTNSRLDNVLIYTNTGGEILTLLGSNINNGGGTTIGNETHLRCGASLVVIDNMAVMATAQMLHAIKCSQNIYADIGKYTHIRLSYVARDIANTSDPLEPISQGGFTYGEILTIFLLLVIFIMSFFNILQRWIFGVRIENPTSFRYDKNI